jgi:hypothetical protein
MAKITIHRGSVAQEAVERWPVVLDASRGPQSPAAGPGKGKVVTVACGFFAISAGAED